jgi:hypothetical protein
MILIMAIWQIHNYLNLNNLLYFVCIIYMDDLKLNKIKSCQGIINNNITTIEFPRKISLIDFFKNIKFQYQTNENTYLGETSVLNLIRQSLKSYDNILDKSNMYICPIDKDYYSTITDIPQYVINLYNNQDNTEIIYHRSYLYEDDKYIILPDITKNIISNDDTNKLNNLIKDNKINEIYEFLYNIDFVLFVKGYNTLFDLDLAIIYEIKLMIINYIKQFIPDLDEVRLRIYTKCNSKYKFITFNFYLFDFYNDVKYIKYTDAVMNIDIKDLISNLENNKNFHCNIRISKNDTFDTQKYCSNNNIKYDLDNFYKKDLYNQYYNKNIINKKRITNNDIFFLQNINNLEILIDFYRGSEKYNYCADTYLVKSNNNIYEISIKSITVDKLITSRFFKLKYKQQLFNIIRDRPLIENNDFKYWYNTLPAYYQIEIKQLNDINQLIFNGFIEETFDEYNTLIKPLIKDLNQYKLSAKMFYLTIYLVCKYKNNNINQEYEQLMKIKFNNKIPINALYENDFIIFNRESIYMITYAPNIIVYQWDKLIGSLNNISEIETELITNMDLFNKYTNFGSLYRNELFKHNIRDFTNINKINIYQLIKNYIITFNLKYDDMICVNHYPNYKNSNILHFHVYSPENYNSRLKKDINYRYIEYSSKRSIIIHFGIETEYKNKIYLLPIVKSGNINNKIDELTKHIDSIGRMPLKDKLKFSH